MKAKGRQQRLYFELGNNGWHSALLLTTRTNQKFVQADSSSTQGLRLKVSEVDKAMYDFNHFVIHASTGRGIYQHYEHSRTLSQCKTFLERTHRSLLQDKLTAALNQTPAQDRKGLRNSYSSRSNPFQMTYVASPTTLSDLLQQMQSISSFQFDVDSMEVNIEPLRSLTGTLKRVRHSLSFKPKTSPFDVAKALIAAFSEPSISKPRARCMDLNGEQVTIDVDLTGLSLFSANFDELADGLVVVPEAFASSQIVNDLTKLANDNSSLLSAPESA